MRIRLAAVDAGEAELDAIARVLASGTLTNGPETAAFEREFAARHGCEHGVAFASGTVALVALLTALGVGPGDEVVVPSFTFISTATAVVHAGATPVFADVQPDTFNLDPADAAARVTPRTRAIVAVHYGGQPADMEELARVAAEAGAVLVEDAAEAHGAEYRGRPVGSLGAAAMFSFTPTKNMTTGEGGMVTTADGELAARLRLLRNHGQTGPYEHAVLGHNWRLTEIQAAMGRVQLAKLDAVLARKQATAAAVAGRWATVPGVRPPVCRPDRTHAYMLYTLLFDGGRDAVADALGRAGIEARIYFPPAHRQPVFAAGGHPALPVTEDVFGRVLSVPFHTRLAAEELDEIRAVVAGAVGR